MNLEVNNLTVELDRQRILEGVSLEVRDGELVSLLGPSGCGKTTMLKAIAGLVPSEGEIIIGGQPVSVMPVHQRGAVVVFQDFRLFPHMTAGENVAFPLKMRGVPRKERRTRAAEYLKKVHLGGREDQPVSQMSGGQQQRVALARALAAEPRLLLLDEPFSALDENLREEMRRLVKSLQRELGITTILVTHDRAEALSMSDRIALMFDGRIVQYAPPREIYTRPATRRAADYFGDCVYLPGRVTGGRFCFELGQLDVPMADGEYVLMLRSDDLQITDDGPLTAAVTGLRYYGAQTALELELPGGARLRKYVSAGEYPGSIRCRIQPREVVLYSGKYNQ